MSKIKVTDIDITIIKQNENDYISLTDMLKAKDGDFFITDWLRNRNTLDFLAVWEQINNPNFNYGEFAAIRNASGTNTFKVSVKEWNEKTRAIGVIAKSGRYGGTYAHKDIAFEFGSWISPAFKLYLITEFQRLKEIESNSNNIEWNFKRLLSKTNYHIHTDAVKEYRIPKENLPKEKEGIVYADEAEILNYAVFGFTAKQWKAENPDLVLKGMNLREFASINELTVISNLESVTAVMLSANVDRKTRIEQLRIIAQSQLKSLEKTDILKSYKRQIDGSFIETKNLPEKKNK